VRAVPESGIRIDTEDAIIAATALPNSSIVLTANTRRFAPTAALQLNPFVRFPPDAE
jgi:predicted nucleic acid-binding protein